MGLLVDGCLPVGGDGVESVEVGLTPGAPLPDRFEERPSAERVEAVTGHEGCGEFGSELLGDVLGVALVVVGLEVRDAHHRLAVGPADRVEPVGSRVASEARIGPAQATTGFARERPGAFITHGSGRSLSVAPSVDVHSLQRTEPPFSLAVGYSGVSQRLGRLSPRHLVAFGALVAAVATAGSLYLSLGMGLIPCELCWYQRILMYPLVVVFGVAVVEGRSAVYRTVLPLSILGASIAAYHSWLQIAGSGLQCGVGGGCGAVLLRVFGLTIPNLSLIAFLLVTVTAVVLWRFDAAS